jgi:hypothetical protein
LFDATARASEDGKRFGEIVSVGRPLLLSVQFLLATGVLIFSVITKKQRSAAQMIAG